MKAAASLALWQTSNKHQLATGETLLSAQCTGSNLQRALVLRPQHQFSAASPLWPSCQCPGTGRSSLSPASHQSAALLLAGTHAHQAELPAGAGDLPRPAPHTHTHHAVCLLDLGPRVVQQVHLHDVCCSEHVPKPLSTDTSASGTNKDVAGGSARHLCHAEDMRASLR